MVGARLVEDASRLCIGGPKRAAYHVEPSNQICPNRHWQRGDL